MLILQENLQKKGVFNKRTYIHGNDKKRAENLFSFFESSEPIFIDFMREFHYNLN